MNLQFYLEKLQASDEFKNFIRENPKAFSCSGFFVIDKKGSDNKQHFDYCLPDSKEIFSFQVEDGIKKIKMENIGERIPEKISLNYEIDFERVEKIIQGEMWEKGVKKEIQKIMISLQNLNKKDFLICTVFVSGLGILKATISLPDMRVVDFDSKSFFDMVNVFKKK